MKGKEWFVCKNQVNQPCNLVSFGSLSLEKEKGSSIIKYEQVIRHLFYNPRHSIIKLSALSSQADSTQTGQG
jgi:hypothetical protein